MTKPKIKNIYQYLAIIVMMATLSSCDFFAVNCRSDLSLEASNLEQIKQYEGCEATVSGLINSTYIPHEGNVAFINVGNSDYQKAFTVVIFKADFHKFKSLANLADYEGDFIKVRGKINIYKNKPQIIVNNPEQITIEVGL